MTRYAIAYDVSNDSLRSKVRSICRKYGARRQYSLFEVRLSETEQAEMTDELRQLVAENDSSQVHIRIYSVGPEQNDIDIPKPTSTDEEPANIV